MAGYIPLPDGVRDASELSGVVSSLCLSKSPSQQSTDHRAAAAASSIATISQSSVSLHSVSDADEEDVESAVFSDKLDSLAREREYLACSLDKIHSSNRALQDELQKLGYTRSSVTLSAAQKEKPESLVDHLGDRCTSSTSDNTRKEHGIIHNNTCLLPETVTSEAIQEMAASHAILSSSPSHEQQHNVTPVSASHESLTLVGDHKGDNNHSQSLTSLAAVCSSPLPVSMSNDGRALTDSKSEGSMYTSTTVSRRHTEPWGKARSKQPVADRGELQIIISPRKPPRKEKMEMIHPDATIEKVKAAQRCQRTEAVATNTDNAIWKRKNRQKIWSSVIQGKAKSNRSIKNHHPNIHSCTRACKHSTTEDQINHLKYINHIKSCHIERLEANNAELRKVKRENSRLQHKLSGLRGKLEWRDHRTECLSSAVDILEKEYYHVLTKMDEIQRMFGLEKILSEQECGIISRFVVRSHIQTKNQLQKVFELGENHTDVIQQQTNYCTDLKIDFPEIAEEHPDENDEEGDIDLHQAMMSSKNTRPRTYPLPTVPSQQPTIDQVYGISHTSGREPALNHHKHNRRRRGRRKRGEEVPGTDEDVTDLPSRWDNFTLRK